MDGAKLVQRARLVPAFLLLPGQVEILARMLPRLIAASRKATDLTERQELVVTIVPCADADISPGDGMVIA